MSQKYKVVMILTQDEMDDMAGALITTDVSVGGRVHQIADDLRELAGDRVIISSFPFRLPTPEESAVIDSRLYRAAAERVCLSTDLCFEGRDWVKCGPCSLKLEALKDTA
jgi:hypothetical protein